MSEKELSFRELVDKEDLYIQFIELESAKEMLEDMKSEINKRLNNIDIRKKEICPHNSIFKYGGYREASEDDLFYGSHIVSAKIKCKMCGKHWNEIEDDFLEMKKIINNAKEVLGEWEVTIKGGDY